MNAPAPQEPVNVYPEKLFEIAISSVIQTAMRPGLSLSIVPNSSLDLAVNVKRLTASRTVYIEAKSYAG